ncbi:hypothetical protein CC77DRAFT_1012801 [Alternaria alternata]|uniref:Uncharacterized protein n=1 Tax=Alternaria alternata TaxID=5599 RepID=A0A177D7X6_ALTAL|nr:hypothetical protein CC77DRAFT_1012801 [Alternaria alternata]OAG15636.1 hypothetical protein CC77DRAFT_1012801 [Alternaria alternata]
MFGRNLFIAASLAALTLAAPTPTSAVVQHEEAIVERRDAFSLTGLIRDVLKRHASIEAIPDATFDIVVDRRSEETENEGDDVEIDTTEESSEDKRGLNRPGAGGSKRGLNRPGAGGSKRGLNRPGAGGSKRGLNRPGAGGSKRGLNRPGNGGSK